MRLADSLPDGPRARLREQLIAGLTGEATLIPLFHLLRTAALLRDSGFTIRFTGLAEGTPHDLLVERERRQRGSDLRDRLRPRTAGRSIAATGMRWSTG